MAEAHHIISTFSKMTSMQPFSRSSVSMFSSFTCCISFCIFSSVSLLSMLRNFRYTSYNTKHPNDTYTERTITLTNAWNTYPLTGTLKQQSNNNTAIWWLVHWPLMGGCYILYSEEGPGRAVALPSPLLAVPNVRAHPSTASVTTSYCSLWLCNFLCTIKS